MGIELNKNDLESDLNNMFDSNAEFPFNEIIKQVEKKTPLPKFKSAYDKFMISNVEEKYGNEIAEFDSACLIRDLLIKRLAEEFVELHAREAESPYNKSWILPVQRLDFSIDSLKLIDRKNNYSDSFKSNFSNKEILPLLTGYVLHSIFSNKTQQGWNIVYANNLYKTALKPNAGKKEIAPCDYIKSCLFGGFKLSELTETLNLITIGLEENYSPWRRQYLSRVSNP